MVEDAGPLASLSSLYSAVAQVMGDGLTPQIIKARITEWNIPVKTKPGRKRPTKLTPVITHPPTSVVQSGHRIRTIYAPGGKCPYRLPAADYDTVVTWASKVREHGLADKWNGVYSLVEALIYYSRQMDFGFTPEELGEITNHLLEWDELCGPAKINREPLDVGSDQVGDEG